jgi:hypothetical protein
MDHPNSLLQTIKIPYYANLRCTSLGLDSLDHCFDKKRYATYPDRINYVFNEIGYRHTTINHYRGNEILAIGDSFTLGLGVNHSDCWSYCLENMLDYPVLNFSLNGASNDWMARKIKDLLKVFKPRCVIVHYSFSHRRESPMLDWHDDERTQCDPLYSSKENFENWRTNFDTINSYGVPVVHSFISNWHDQPVDYDQFPGSVVPPVAKQDLARDGFHYGAKTHQHLADRFYHTVTNLLGS